MASRHDDFLAAGARLFGVVIDSPQQNAAMIEKLSLPFPLLSDPDRSAAIEPFGVANPTDRRNIAHPAIVVVSTSGAETWRWVARDYADRIPEDDVLVELASLELPPTSQDPPAVAHPKPGPHAMPLDKLSAYLRGARFAAVALGGRHPTIAADTADYVAEMDRFLAAIKVLAKK